MVSVILKIARRVPSSYQLSNRDMRNIEEIRKEFMEKYGPDTDMLVSAHQDWTPKAVADWWLSQIESREEGLKMRTEWLEKYADLHCCFVSDVLNGVKPEDAYRTLDKGISLLPTKPSK